MDLFGTAGIRGTVGDRITADLALAVGRAVAADAEMVVVGRDGRTTGAGLADALAGGLAAGDAAVRRAGVVPTPALAFVSRGRHGVMLTASHNPPADNGIKVFADGREYDREGERRIEERVADPPAPAGWDHWGGTERVDVLADYRAAVVAYVADHGADPDGLAVAVDAGNGVGALATPAVLRTLGADVTALNANVDGHFPGRASKPTAETLADARAFVAGAAGGDVAAGEGTTATPADDAATADGDTGSASDDSATDEDAPGGGFDLGFAHDGDADRVVVLDAAGEVVHEDTVVAILAEHYVHRSDAADPVVVTTPNASGRIDERVAAAGGRVERVRLGALHEGIDRVRREGGEGTAVAFAAEPWKHVHPAFGGWIDGVTSAAVLTRLAAAAGGLDALREPVAERPYRKVSVDCPDGHKGAAMDRVGAALPAAFADASVDTDHGVRVTLPDGSWVLVRPSGTEPFVRIYAEGEDVDDLVATAREVVASAVEVA